MSPHVDHWFNPSTEEYEVVQDKVGLVFLDEMDEAYFSHRADAVVPKKGSLVIFDGNAEHTVILPAKGGGSHLHLLGPYSLSDGNGLILVGGETSYPVGTPFPTPVPTHAPTKKGMMMMNK